MSIDCYQNWMPCRRFINLVGAMACVVNCAFDVIYAFKVEYMTKSLFYFTCFFLVVRLVVTLLVGQYHHTLNKKMVPQSEHELSSKEVYSSYYKTIHILYYTGFYRLMPSC